MVDMILFIALASVFAGGFLCGSKYGTAKAMFADIKARIKNCI